MGLLSQLAGVGGGASTLQRGATGISQYSNQASPQMQTLNMALPTLQNLLQNNGAASGLDALRPVFQQNLQDSSNRLMATAPGGRFSSGMLQAQGQLGQRSTNDFNLMASQMLQQGVQNQLGAAQTLGGLSNQAGNAQMNALQMLLGPAFQSMFQGGYAPSGLQQGMQAGGGLAALMTLLQGQGGGGQVPVPPRPYVPNVPFPT